MKKISKVFLIFIFVCSTALSASALELTVKAGVDCRGEFNVVDSTDYDVKPGFNVAGEAYISLLGLAQIGGGLEYQIERAFKDHEDIKFNFMPIYASFRFPFEIGPIAPFAIAKIGYNSFFVNDAVNNADPEGGLYWGIGAGCMFSNILLEIDYSENNGKLVGQKVKYSKVTVALGLNLNLL